MTSTRLVAAAIAAAFALPAVTSATALPANKRLMVTSCVVMFATKSSGASATNSGLFDTTKASNVTVSVLYELDGVGADRFQRIADQVCGETPARLTAAGYELVPFDAADPKAVDKFLAGGKASPVTKKIGDISYVAYAPTGQRVLDPALVSGMGQFKHPYAEATVARQADAQPLRITYTVDFAAVEGEKPKNRLAGLGGQRTASVTADVSLAVSGAVMTYDSGNTKCYKALSGAEECTNNDAIPGPNGKALMFIPEQARTYDEAILNVQDTTGSANKAAQGAVNAIAMVAGSRRQKFTGYTVSVDPEKYEAGALDGTASLVDDALAYFANPPAKGKKPRQ